MSQDDIQRNNDASYEDELDDLDQPDSTGMRPDQSSEGDKQAM